VIAVIAVVVIGLVVGLVIFLLNRNTCTAHEDADLDGLCDHCGESMPQSGLHVTKVSCRDTIRTVHPGEEITYTFTLQNTADHDEEVTLTDQIPTQVVYRSGDGELDGSTFTVRVTVPANTTLTKSYTVAVKDDDTLLGSALTSTAARANGTAVPSDTLYIARTFNQADRDRFVKAIWALDSSPNVKIKGTQLLDFLYTIAFSASQPISNTPANILSAVFLDTDSEKTEAYTALVTPGLYGGRAVTPEMDARVLGERELDIKFENFLPGDILCTLPSKDDLSGANIYVTDGIRLYDITTDCEALSDTSVIANLQQNDFFAFFRLSMGMTNEWAYRSQPVPEGATDIERAIIATAEAYLLRGARMQYADTSLTTKGTIYRWERGKAPEDYTRDETGYSNCTGFVHDVTLHALGYDYGSFQLKDAPAAMKAYTYNFTGTESAAIRAAIEQEYKATLQIGDIVFYTYSSNTHALLYVGNGNLIHCTGSKYKNFTEVEEPSIRYLSLDSLFRESSTRYLFQTNSPRTALYIIRPLNTWTQAPLPAATQARIANMRGIMAEKTASATLGQTVAPGSLITYTFTLFNATANTTTLAVTDRVPSGTQLFKNGNTSNETDLSFEVQLLPGEKKTVSYTVQVSQTATKGTAILCADESRVGGIPTKAPAIYVGRNLTATEQATLLSALAANSNPGTVTDAIALANAIYKQVLGVDNILGTSMDDLFAGVFRTDGSLKTIATSGTYAEMIAPSLYGGKNVNNSTRFDGERTRLPRERNLLVGDILFLSGASKCIYIYVGNGMFLDLQKGLNERDAYERLEETIGWQHFAILRPSLIVD